MTSPDLDPSSYLQALASEQQATSGFEAQLRQTAMAAAPMQRAMNALTPSKAALAGWGALAAAAGNTQAQLSTMTAQAKVTHASMGQLEGGMRSLARSYGIGNAGARELYQALSSLGTVSQGTEGNVRGLGKVFTQLSGAVGEGSGGLASGFIQLNRAMGTGVDATRMGKLSDSLTTVSAQSGASATGILNFAKSIAPMAHATGIGETKVLGISAAFTKMGDDGLGAATAFNKMLGDLNKSVREGSPMITTYAQIVGKTADQFTALVKTNPAEAITQVTEALGKSGGNAPRQLEQLGLDGVRSQRYLQELSQSGGLRSAISTSVGAYGSGSTQTASKEAFNTWADATQKAAANAQQLGEAFGAPLLKPLTVFTNVIGAASTPLRAVAESKVGQTLIELAAGLLLFSKVLKPLTAGALARGALTSGPVTSAMAGVNQARGTTSRFASVRAQQGLMAGGLPMGTGQMAGVNAGFGRFGQGLGGLAPGGVGAGASAWSLLRNGGLTALSAYPRLTSEMYRNAFVPASQRATRYMKMGDPTPGRMDRFLPKDYRHMSGMIEDHHLYQQQLQRDVAAGKLTPEAARTLGRDARTYLGSQLGGMSRGSAALMAVRGASSLPIQAGMAAGRMGGAALGMAGRGAMSMFGGPAGMAMMAGSTIGMMAYRGHQAAQADFAGAKTSTGFLDDYRVAMGKATEATSTFAGKMAATADQLTAGITSMDQALKVDAQARQIASQTTKQVTTFAGDNKSIAAGLRTQVAGGATPDEIARMRTDLIKQYGSTKAGAILADVQGYAGTSGTDLTGDIRTQMAGVGNAKGQGNWRGVANGLTSNRWFGGSNSSTSGVEVSTLTKGQKGTIRSMVADIETRRQGRVDAGGEQYGNSRARAEMDAAIQGAMDSGNDQALYKLENEFQGKYGVKSRRIKAGDIRKAGGFANWEAANSGKFADTFGRQSTQAQAQEQQSQLAKSLTGNALSSVFLGSKVQGLIGANGAPESPQAQTQALSSIMASAGSGTDNLLKLAQSSLDAANSLGDVTDAGKLALAAFAQASQQLRASAPFQTSGASAMSGARLAATAAATTPTNAATQQIHDQGVSDLQSAQANAVGYAQQRLAQIREFQISMRRSQQDYQQQVDYSAADFHRGQLRAEEDYDRAVFRTQRNFQTQMSDSAADYQRQRAIATRDFNKQQTRQAEDAAKTMYDPYQRIQAKGVWDPQSLSGNMAEQAQAMQAQIANLAKLRKSGMSDSAITLLGLNDPNNAQQLASAVSDLVNDPKLVATLNSQASQRQTLAGQLLGDPSNAAFQRQKADFATSMQDSANAYSISVSRAKRNLHVSLADMASDQSRSLARALTDYNTATSRMASANAKMISRAGEDLARSDEQIVGTLSQLTDALGQGVNVQVSTWSSLLKSGMKDWVGVLQAFQKGDWQALVRALGTPALVIPTARTGAHNDPDYAPANRHAAGAIFSRAHAYGGGEIGEGGPEMVLPLNARGAQFLADTFDRVGTSAENRHASHGPTIINNMQTYHYDHSVRPEHVEVSANDPGEFGETMRRRAVLEKSSKPAVLR